MKIIGLTGPSGSGKSTLWNIAEDLGYCVIDCDRVSRAVTEKASLLKSLEDAFGGVVTNGVLDRKLLAEKAFASSEKTELLNSIMLPVIKTEIDSEINNLKNKGATHILLDAPTLYESGEDKICSAVVAVLADEKTRAERLVQRDKLNEKQLKSRLNASKPPEFYTEKTEYIIYNNGNLAEYKKKAKNILKKLK